MSKIGLVGGLGPASTIDYYEGLIQRYQKDNGLDDCPEIVIDSVNMHDVMEACEKKDMDMLEKILEKSFQNLKAAGADYAAITFITPHIVWDTLKKKCALPVISIVETVVSEVLSKGYQSALLFGTEITMSSGMYERDFQNKGIRCVLPDKEDQKMIGKLISLNLENGIMIPEDREKMIAIAEKYIEKEKVDIIIFGCTELPLIIKQGDVSVPVLDMNELHKDKIYSWSFLSQKERLDEFMQTNQVEYFDIRDEHGEITGEIKERGNVHKDGDIHGTSHVWIVRKNDNQQIEVLLQKRSANKDSHPGCYDTSSAGHIQAGQDFMESALRELEEELGLVAQANDLKCISIHDGQDHAYFYGKPFNNHEISKVFIYVQPVDEKKLVLQESEVESVCWMNIEEVIEALKHKDKKFCMYLDEVEEVLTFAKKCL